MLPPDHPHRVTLNDEVHARPPEPLRAPLSVSFMALLSSPALREKELEHVAALAQRFHAPPPEAGANHYSADFGPFRVKWERHTEWARYKFIVRGVESDPFSTPALRHVPKDWLSNLLGQMLTATHVALIPEGDLDRDIATLSQRHFAGNVLLGSRIARGGAQAFTDFRIHTDGFSRLLVADRSMTRRQAGRMIQRLLEIDAYRMLALLALPVARELTPFLSQAERELALITTALVGASERDENALLERLTRLQASLHSREADNHYRFNAAAAYYQLVHRRIVELREEQITGLQTFQEFTERRLAPAMNTCEAVSARLDNLSPRVARATQLISTRVDIQRQLQNKAVLESMNRRAMLQLRLQETVEGLSVAAITYYVVGLVGYASKAVSEAGVPINTDLIVGMSIPVVAVVFALGVRRVRKMVSRRGG